MTRMPNLASKNGRGERIRTSDHLNPIQVRYLAALHPDRSPVILTKILA